VYTAAMGFTSDACWFLLLKSLLIKDNKKREEALKNEAGGDEKHVFFPLALKRAFYSIVRALKASNRFQITFYLLTIVLTSISERFSPNF